MTAPRLGLACVFALVCAIGCALPAAAQAGEIIVARDAGLSAAERADVRADAGVKLESALALPNTEVVSAPAGEETAAVAALNADPDVRFAVPEISLYAASSGVTTDASFFRQWALDGTAYPHIDIVKAWERSENDGEGVTVAVIDQEVDVANPDLAGNILPSGRDFTVPNGCSVATPTGEEDHGTYIAGIVAAEHNSIGIAGIAPKAKLLPLRAVDNCGVGKSVPVMQAMIEAGAEDVPIVVAAFATLPGRLDPAVAADYNRLFAEIFGEYDKTLFVVPAGNEGNDNDVLPVYPCSTVDPDSGEVPNLVCVGATNKTDRAVCAGNVGRRSVDLFAPGVDIWSTVRGGLDGVQPGRGSSASAAIVAGVAALVKADEPTAGPEEIRYALTNTNGVSILGLAEVSESGARINAARALGGRGNLNAPGPGGIWTGCDFDHDGLDNNEDICVNQYGPRELAGCPDNDGDGVRDIDDNCAAASNGGQADDDGDFVGNVCDPTPRGDDADGDGKPFLDDACPTTWGTLPTGCPDVVTPRPTVTPSPSPGPPPPAFVNVSSVSVKVTPKKCPRGRSGCLKAAKVTIRLTRTATASLRFEQRVKRGRRMVWKRYTTKSMSATTSARSMTLKRLKAGSYRVIVTVGGKGKSKTFRV